MRDELCLGGLLVGLGLGLLVQLIGSRAALGRLEPGLGLAWRVAGWAGL